MIRIPLPVALIQDIDLAVGAGAGGFESRTDLVREAVEAYLAELKYGVAEEPTSLRPSRPVATPATDTDLIVADESGFEKTRLGKVAKCLLISKPVAKVDEAPLFFHNRDFPSLWAARAIARITTTSLVPFEPGLRFVTEQAWQFAALLKNLPAQSLKPTALFPTNLEKREAAETAFRNFAIGTLSHVGSDARAAGPLFSWHLCQVELVADELRLGLTKEGWQLLRDMSDISAHLPHSEALAKRFLGHLRIHAPNDFWGFDAINRIVQQRPTREELNQLFEHEAISRGFRWSTHQVANYANGYVGRSREWGLIEPKQDAGRYVLTTFGMAFGQGGT